MAANGCLILMQPWLSELPLGMKAYLDRDLDLELALLLEDAGDLLRLLLLALPLSFVVSASGLPFELDGSSLVCDDMMQVAGRLYVP